MNILFSSEMERIEKRTRERDQLLVKLGILICVLPMFYMVLYLASGEGGGGRKQEIYGHMQRRLLEEGDESMV